MSKFWQGSSSSESESDDGSDSEAENNNNRAIGGKQFGDYQESDSESDNEARVVRSQKDRTWDSIRDGTSKIRNALKNNDWPLIQGEYEDLNKKVEKSRALMTMRGETGLPACYIKILAAVEDELLNTLKDKDGLKKLKPAVIKAINQMKLKVRKHNDKYRDKLLDFKANPQNYASDDEESEESSEESEEEAEEEEDESSDDEDSDEDDDDEDKNEESGSSSSSEEGDDNEDDDSDDSLFGSEGDSESDGDSDTASEASLAKPELLSEDSKPVLAGRAKWLKKAATTSKPVKERPAFAAAAGENRDRERERDRERDDGKPVRRVTHEPTRWTADMVDKKLNEIVQSRGKKSTDVRGAIRQLEMLSKITRADFKNKEIPVLMHLIAAMFDSQKVFDEYMELQKWRTCHSCLKRVASILNLPEHRHLVLGVVAADDEMNGNAVRESNAVPHNPKSSVLRVVGSLESFILRLEDEYTKSLQQINPHTQEYVVRLADEAALIELAESIFVYYDRIGDRSAAASVALLHVEHIYYKHDSVSAAVQRAHMFNQVWGRRADLHPACAGRPGGDDREKPRHVAAGRIAVETTHPAACLGTPSVTCTPVDSSARMDTLCHFIFKHGDDRGRTRALLCSVHHHSLHDRFYRARDLFLISHIQDVIDKTDTKTQILYNRALVTLGLSAFRLGLIQKAHDCLAGICTGRVKELLAQGHAKWHGDKDPEQEKIERRRQMPYHMHINPDLLECCHLICAMLLELPQMARVGGPSPNIISRHFRKYFAGYTRQVFTGPPENSREHVLAAAKCLLTGDWQRSLSYILGLEVWNLIPGDGGERVKSLLKTRLKEEAVRVYLLTFGVHYESLSLAHLCEMFDMEAVCTRRIISRMIFNREISAAWEHPADVLIIYKVDATPIQSLSQAVAEKLATLTETNERLLDPFSGSGLYGYKDKDDWQSTRGGGGGNKQQTGPSQGTASAATAGNTGAGGGGGAQVVGAAGEQRRQWRQGAVSSQQMQLRVPARTGARGRTAGGKSSWGAAAGPSVDYRQQQQQQPQYSEPLSTGSESVPRRWANQ